MKDKQPKQLVIYQSKSGVIEFRGDFECDTVWGNQQQIANVFGINRTVVTKYVNKILKDGEVDKKAMCKKCTLQILTNQ